MHSAKTEIEIANVRTYNLNELARQQKCVNTLIDLYSEIDSIYILLTIICRPKKRYLYHIVNDLRNIFPYLPIALRIFLTKSVIESDYFLN